MSIVKLTFSPNGQTQVETNGVPGTDCRKASGPYMETIGGKVTDDQPTAEAALPSMSEGTDTYTGQH